MTRHAERPWRTCREGGCDGYTQDPSGYCPCCRPVRAPTAAERAAREADDRRRTDRVIAFLDADWYAERKARR